MFLPFAQRTTLPIRSNTTGSFSAKTSLSVFFRLSGRIRSSTLKRTIFRRTFPCFPLRRTLKSTPFPTSGKRSAGVWTFSNRSALLRPTSPSPLFPTPRLMTARLKKSLKKQKAALRFQRTSFQNINFPFCASSAGSMRKRAL